MININEKDDGIGQCESRAITPRPEILVKPAFNPTNLHSYFEVWLGPSWITLGKRGYHVSEPVRADRAAEIVTELLRGIQMGDAFLMPTEFRIVGRIETIEEVKKSSGRTK